MAYWDFVNKTDYCWVWLGPSKGGYGRYRIAGKNFQAHRFAFELLRYEIPKGLVLDHLCRNRTCVNPDHLEPVTARENVHRGYGPTAINARKTCCIYGHPLTPENLVPNKDGWRKCKVCHRRHSRESMQRRRGTL